MTTYENIQKPGMDAKLNKVKKFFAMLLLYLFLIVLCALFFFPVYHAFVLSTVDNKANYSGTPPLFFSDHLPLNLNLLSNAGYFYRSIFNSSIIAVLATATQVFFCTMGGFAFAKYEFKGKKLIFALVLATLMIPRLLFIIPLYKIMVWFRWIDTYLPMFIPDMANAFGIYLMSQYIKKLVPNALIDAGRMDGLTGFGTLMKVVFPVAAPGIAVLGTIVFFASWNNFQLAFVMLTHREMFTIPISLFTLYGQVLNTSVKTLAIVISQAPLMFVFLVFSRQIIKNMVAGSIKG
ncbi:MAG: carbohydrate ABC transporter permease [Spirochaetales bacterium]|nr:carbohydrate ABC transporter permease [Spirochaetales bacterium]